MTTSYRLRKTAKSIYFSREGAPVKASMQKMRVIVSAILVVLVAGGALAFFAFVNRGSQPAHFTYRQDPRTGLCFAKPQTTHGIAHVPCEAIPPALLEKE